MKKFYLAILFLTAAINSFSQTALEVAESTLKIGGLREEEFYYGFAEGDQLVFSFEEVNGKELKEVEIIELPSSSKFMDYKTTKIESKTINILRTGIYKFRFSNSAVSGRICKYKIQRIPVNESTKNFNPSVYWKTIYDTTYRTVQERYLVRREYKPVTIASPATYFINSGSNATFKNGKSRITFPIVLPANTQEWYYTFSSYREPEDIAKVKSTMNLTSQLANLISGNKALGFGIDMLTKPPGGNICDIYQMDFNNSRLFEAKQQYNYFTIGTRENLSSGVVKVTGGANQTFYIGIKNPDTYYGIHVLIEVVAIILEEEWAVRNVEKVNITSREEAYLRK